MHRVSGRWRLGLALALVTVFAWGILPIALKVVLQRMDAFTITWYRVAAAAAVMTGILGARRTLPPLQGLTRRHWWLLGICLVGLVGNWVMYVGALNFTTPAVAQTVVQLSPLFLLLGGLVIYKEPFSRVQWLGFAGLVGGLLLFFNRRLPELAQVTSGLGAGVLLLLCSSLVWASYALAQKTLLKRFTSPQILWLMYVGAVALVFPFSTPADVRTLDAPRGWLLAFCCANTLVGYGAFAEALDHWEVSRVSAVLAMAPIVTLVASRLTSHFAPGLIEPEQLTTPTVAGALIVVLGSALSALGQRWGASPPEGA